jgi:hypothetical protein
VSKGFEWDEAVRDRRAVRDGLVAAGSALAALGFLLSGVAVLLELIEIARIGFAPTSYEVGKGFDILHNALLVIAFVLATLAFAGRIEARERRIAAAAAIAVGAFTVLVVAQALYASSQPRYAGALVTVDVLAALAATVLVVAAVAASIAFRNAAATPPSDQSRRDGLLGWAAGALTLSLALSTASASVYMSAVRLVGGGDAGLRVGVAGLAVGIGGGAIASIALLVSQRQQRQAAPRWMPQREGLLALALAVFVVGFLLVGIGNAIVADASSSSKFVQELLTTAHWVEATSGWMVSAGLALAGCGFFASYRGRSAPKPNYRAAPR